MTSAGVTMLSLLILILPSLGNAALASGYRMVNAVWSALAIDREADASFEAVCLFSFFGLTLTLTFCRLTSG
jgi:hypothetical protein